MIWRAVICILITVVCLGSGSASADKKKSTDVEPKGDALSVHSQVGAGGEHPASDPGGATSTSQQVGVWTSHPACEVGGAGTCVEAIECDAGGDAVLWTLEVEEVVVDSYYACPTEATDDPVEITDDMVLRAFKRIPLPESELVVQPPGGETLVNFATNFYTEAGPFERSVNLVGQQVDLRIWPSRFDWAYGDGEQASTTEPGAAYPDLVVTHEYRTAGQVGPSVSTTYSAEFRVNGGAWAPVVGTVTMAGEPVGLQVRTATPTLVGY